MASLDIVQIPVLSDNYVYLIHDPESGATAAVDPAKAEPVLAALAARGWTLTHILNTHHHPDHVGGNLALKAATGCTIVGNRADAARLPGLDVGVGEGDTVTVGGATAEVLEVSGHTMGHVAYWFPQAAALFCGDTLFALGCGRMFEGDPATFWASLAKLRALPDAARVHCAHEYTLANWRFAASVDPDNPALQARGAAIRDVRERGMPTVPSLLGDEKATNPFLRADDPALAARLGLAGRPPAEVFAEIRHRKDRF
ncbi:hydroxyacylglutathione hydrolase [Novispirillum sp. DQ9]|uniref:hydroxyacylglutathione hydrolase n=1 Tax=Novispirillum sp. DQ9 TaxID=3398612 RepID=UPI003C7E8D8F